MASKEEIIIEIMSTLQNDVYSSLCSPADDLDAIRILINEARRLRDRNLLIKYYNLLDNAVIGLRSEAKRPAGIDYLQSCRAGMEEEARKKI